MEKKSEWLSTLLWVLMALFLALSIRSFLFEPFRIPSGSMRPSLEVGDFIFVSKYNYGYSQYSFPFDFLKFKGRFFALNLPKRGDIVVFRNPVSPNKTFVKRLIGLPGERVQLRDGILWINGRSVARTQIEPYKLQFGDSQILVARYKEVSFEGSAYQIIELHANQGSLDNTVEYIVPEGHYFMMGDNRDGSQDSRFLADVGFVPYENLIGPARFIWFSFDKDKPWYRILRLERFFDTLVPKK